MNVYPIQTNFTSGVLSPRFWSRSDIAQYSSGFRDSQNMITTRHGPIQSRNGTEFLSDFGSNYCRPFGFQLIPNSITGEAFTAVVSEDGTITLVGATGTLYEQELLNPDFSLSLDNWTKIFVDGSSFVQWSSGAALLTPEAVQNGESCGVTQQVTVTVGTESDDRVISYEYEESSGRPLTTRTIKIGTTSGGDDLVSTTDTEIIFNPAGLTSFWVTFEVQNTKALNEPETGQDPETYGSVSLQSFTSSLTSSGAIEFTHTWTAADIQNLHTEMAPNENSMYFVCQSTAPHKLSFELDSNTWSFDEVSFTGEPSEWAAGNYPTTMGFFGGRSWWAGVESKPQTFWGSQPNDDSSVLNELENLTTGTTAGDGLEFTLSRSGRIRWIEGGSSLMIGTTSGEFLISSSMGVIAPDDILVTQQSSEGGEAVNAKAIGDMVMFISGNGRKLLASRYFEQQNQWRAQEISFMAEHLTLGKKIIQIAYARNPESIIWCLLDDGSLVGCTYDPFNNSMGWHQHSIGSIQGISVVEKSGASILSLTVERVIDGSTTTMLERLGSDYMDSYSSIAMTTTSVSVPHLAGETVVVKIDDAQQPDITLDENGDGVLEYIGDTAVIGLEMPVSVTTLEPDMGSQAGTSMGFTKRFNNIVARIYDSAIPLINGTRPAVRNASTLMGNRESNKTQDVSVTNLGNGDGSTTVSQSLPYKLTLTGLFGKLSQNKAR